MKTELNSSNQTKWDKAFYISSLLIVLPAFFTIALSLYKLIKGEFKSVNWLHAVISLLATLVWAVALIIYGKLLLKKQQKEEIDL